MSLGQQWQMAVNEKREMLVELPPCTLTACDDCQLTATPSREHVMEVAEL